MKKINPNLYPHDGYYFVDSDGARIFGDTWNGVVVRVKKYRERAGLPPGNPMEEVMAAACARNPGYCHEANSVSAEQLTKATLKSRILKWLSDFRKIPNKQFVGWDLVHARADVCARCPKNTALPGGCASCRAAVKEARTAIIGDRPIDARLNACVVLGEDPVVTGYFEMQTVENSELPAECWRKRTL